MLIVMILAIIAYVGIAVGFCLLSLFELSETGRAGVMPVARAVSWSALWPMAIAFAVILAWFSNLEPSRAGRK
ncbi:hypothetical protein [Oryzibacter oryziterrae]|uniref:hypothetical protein n=1 Tax=Oryzibacter oryziterrae TaxID=2766474 RepID=UPI001F378AB8|nr:hypothetical protein [Oryzibacter oryziterrae]